MYSLVRNAGLLLAFLVAPAVASAATQKEIDAAIKKGADALKAKYTRGGQQPGGGIPAGDGGYGIGPTCLAGLAILESGAPGNDPAVKTITETIRTVAYTQTRTYQISLCLFYLDRYGDPADEPLIQALAARLLVAQTSNGGWGYECIGAVSQADIDRLKAIKPGPAGKLNPEIEKYGQGLAAARGQSGGPVLTGDDNSNTQFAILAVWMARKHGAPVESALEMIEKRFLLSQNARTGGWDYNGPAPNGMQAANGFGSPSMYCAGLLGLATGIARHEEARLKHDAPKPEPPKPDPKKNPDDPFFTPPPKPGGTTEPKKPAPRPQTATDRAAQFALSGLGLYVADLAKAGRGGGLAVKEGGQHGHGDLYFFWSLERVGVIFGVDKIGGIDWYDAGAQTLVSTQNPDGSWGGGLGFGGEVSTSFAILFLCKANLARDLAGKVSKDSTTEMKFGGGKGGNSDTKPLDPMGTKPDPSTPPPFVPGATGNEAALLASELTLATDKEWKTVLAKLRDTKGTVYTQALVGAVYRLDGDRKKRAREALAERLTRMTADTLRTMATGDDAELRRGAVLAMAMKDDKSHIPDLVAALSDDEDFVIRAARAGLKSLTGEDFGPAANASRNEKTIATEAWKQWMSKQKK